jgi:hypothetical protein
MMATETRPSEKPGEDGPSGGGVQGPKGFRDETIQERVDKVDPRFVGPEGALARNENEAKTKTSLAEVKLSKPESSSDQSGQLIPPEYRDILGK